MTNQPEDNLREPFNAPGSGPSYPGAERLGAERLGAERSGAEQSFNSVEKSGSAQPIGAFSTHGTDSSAISSPYSHTSILNPQTDSGLQPDADHPLFQSYTQPPVRRPVRIPHFGHLLLLSLLMAVALAVLALGSGIASYFHLFGFKLSAVSATDLKFDLLSEAALYLVTFALSLLVFPMIWHEGYFAGLEWRASVVRTRFALLAGTALACFGLAILDQVALPGPPHAPIEKMMSSTSAAWLMFAFGITLAPFFEEMFFRGFLLPALSTACDWIAERVKGTLPLPLDSTAHPRWSLPAMAIASLITSIAFAGLHVAQQGHSLGPFLLLVLVSLILCAVRLVTRSLAASTVVHAIYNFVIFMVELTATGGFRHFDKL